jgi:hypothetical protein
MASRRKGWNILVSEDLNSQQTILLADERQLLKSGSALRVNSGHGCSIRSCLFAGSGRWWRTITAAIISLIFLLTLGAFAGMAQTITCTFQFMGSGTIGAQTFTNAAITITTVGNTNAITVAPIGNIPITASQAKYTLVNNSASVSVSGVGTFQFTVPTKINVTDNFTATQVPFQIPFQVSFTVGLSPVPNEIGYVDVLDVGLVGESAFTNPWNMLTSFGPITTAGMPSEWNINPITTNGGVMNVYDGTPQVTFQSVVPGTIPQIPTPSRVGVLSHIAAGGWWSTVITLVNTSSAALPVTVALHNDDGSALTLPVTTTQQGSSQTTTTSSVNATINPDATLLVSMGNPVASTVVGWADVSSTGPLGGFAIFRSTPPTGSPSEGTAPLQSQFPSTITLPYDNTAGFVMGVALANLSTSTTNITATMWDANGNQLGTQIITIAGSGHTSFVLPTELPLTAGKLGIVQFQASGGIAGLGLRFSPFGTFTSVPTM